MCTTPQNIYVPKTGIKVGDQKVSVDEFAQSLASGIEKLLGEAERAGEILGAIQSEATLERLKSAPAGGGQVVLASREITHAVFPKARVRTPVIIKLAAQDEKVYQQEMFGPIVYIIATESTDDSIARATRGAREKGAITCSIYCTDPKLLAKAVEQAVDAGASTSCNLTGEIFVNQSAAFSDFHVSGVNPAGNATLTDAAFVAPRFRVAQSRVPVAPAPKP
jgi:acyl-CoA reductase-like NAD-dependent aldehyde dehydrogenase